MLKFSTVTSFCKYDAPRDLLFTHPLVCPSSDSVLSGGKLIGRNAYIVGRALALAGFSLPCFYEGDITELDKSDGKVYMVLPRGTYKVTVRMDAAHNYLFDLP